MCPVIWMKSKNPNILPFVDNGVKRNGSSHTLGCVSPLVEKEALFWLTSFHGFD